jgi:alpha-mannosidase
MHFHIIPNAHIDPVWLWDQNEGLNQAVRSIRSTLELMDEFPFLTYMRGEAALYRHLEATDPEAFKRVLKRIREGRWDVVGGTEVQSDTNLPAAETLMRQYDIGL